MINTRADKPQDVPHILLINPWIDDFAAYDFWAKPLGLLSIGGTLRGRGYRISYIDCLERFDSRGRAVARVGRFGTGAYRKTVIEKPRKLHDVPRRYSRYGIDEGAFRKRLTDLPAPDAILVTALMTYWYPGAFAVIRTVRDVFPSSPVLLGGIYATLCSGHARKYAGADRVLRGRTEDEVAAVVDEITGFSGNGRSLAGAPDNPPYPCFDLQNATPYVPILTGRGCPYRCAYCASPYLNPTHTRRSPVHVVEEIRYWHKRYGVVDFAFYDDALLIDADNHILPILEGVIHLSLDVRLHTPNALHIRPLSREVAELLHRARFKTVRLGLETACFEQRAVLDQKVGPAEFERAAQNLKKAGFTFDELGAYLLFGLPGQDIGELEASTMVVKARGIRPILAQYSPIPHTDLWEESVKASRYDLEADPLFHNNSIFPCQKTPFSWETVSRLKALAQ